MKRANNRTGNIIVKLSILPMMQTLLAYFFFLIIAPR